MIQDQLRIAFGALSDSIGLQLAKQGYVFDAKQAKVFQSHLENMLTLRFADLLTDSMVDKIQKRLFKQIVTHIAPLNKDKC